MTFVKIVKNHECLRVVQNRNSLSDCKDKIDRDICNCFVKLDYSLVEFKLRKFCANGKIKLDLD